MPNSTDECGRAGETCLCVATAHAGVRYRRILWPVPHQATPLPCLWPLEVELPLFLTFLSSSQSWVLFL